MTQQFTAFFQENNIQKNGKRFLIAISGGVDSTVMAELFSKAGLTFGFAHCNFKLRGSESDKDEVFVRTLAEKYKVSCFIKSFETKAYSERKGISIQMAARDLRYKWFAETAEVEKFDYIVTAHNLDDQIETFFINLTRGTGISGLKGIMPVNGKIIRPLLLVSKDEIEKFALENKLEHRHDKSNDTDKYLRNKIRHHITPVLKEANPNFYNTFAETLLKIQSTDKIYLKEINATKKALLKTEGGETLIDIKQLLNSDPPETYLYEFLTDYNFNYSTVKSIVNSLHEQPGKVFYSETHCLLKDRESLIIKKLSEKETGIFQLDENQELLDYPLKLKIISEKYNAEYIVTIDKKIALLDKSKLKFPLKIRKWETGDFFYPLGMNSKKKVSDFFTNEKFNLFEKENTWLLCSGKDIIWVIGHRIDNRYKITDKSKNILNVQLLK
jgi:tRNA(Ile)-lysidine synthase